MKYTVKTYLFMVMLGPCIKDKKELIKYGKSKYNNQ